MHATLLALEEIKPVSVIEIQHPTAFVQRMQTKVAVASHQRKYLVVKTLACAYVVNIVCIAPVYVLWMTGVYYDREANSLGSMFAESMDWLYLLAAPIDSIMYAVVSTDFRRAYSRIIRCR